MSGSEKYSHKLIKKVRVKIPDVPGALKKLGAELENRGAALGEIRKIRAAAKSIITDIVVFFDSEEQVSSPDELP